MMTLQLRRTTAVAVSFALFGPPAIGADPASPARLDLDSLGPVSTEVLDRLRGGHETVLINSQDVRAGIENSAFTAERISSGPVTFERGALQDFRGVGLFNVVTGNHNAVDAVVGVTINLQ